MILLYIAVLQIHIKTSYKNKHYRILCINMCNKVPTKINYQFIAYNWSFHLETFSA